jgi:tRNA (cmo5U34)-methyltransferase
MNTLPQPSSVQHEGITDVRQFFNELSHSYDDVINRAIPLYQEMFETLVAFTFLPKPAPLHIVDIGCGTGNLSLLLSKLYPNARFTLVDLSSELLEQAEKKLKAQSPNTEVTYLEQNAVTLQLPQASVDWVVSTFALHHIPKPEEKATVYANAFKALKPGGVFRCIDGCLGLPHEAYVANTEGWTGLSRAKGATEEQLALWLEHERAFDHFEPLTFHLTRLQQAGFSHVDCYWKKFHWTLFGGSK